jgi:carboxyl-terminal processing protease
VSANAASTDRRKPAGHRLLAPSLTDRAHSAARWLGALLLAVALAACTTLPARPAGGMAADLPDDTAPISHESFSADFDSAAKRVAVLERAWLTIAQRYYDPALNQKNWPAVRDQYRSRAIAAANDAEFYLTLKAMARELDDSHTRIVTPRESADHRRFASRAIGAALSVIDDQLVVVDVDPESPAARADMRRGDVVLAINQHRFDSEFLRAARDLPISGADITSPEAVPAHPEEARRFAQLRAVRRVLQRLPDAPLREQRMRLQRGDGEIVEVRVVPEPLVRPPAVITRRLDSGIALVRLNRFSARNRAEVERVLRESADAPALILDLRGNGGGDYSQFLWLVRQFLPEARTVLTQLTRRGSEQRERNIRVSAGDSPYLGPIAVLTDRRSGSASELTAVVLLEQRDALVVGESTCGCVVGVSWEYVLPGGGGARVSETGFRSIGGRRMEGEPLAPLIYVPPSLSDLRAGRDRALEEAERALLQKLRH